MCASRTSSADGFCDSGLCGNKYACGVACTDAVVPVAVGSKEVVLVALAKNSEVRQQSFAHGMIGEMIFVANT